jgi:hypothetical protein
MNNKDRYIELLKSTNRAGVDKLIDTLEHSDFFKAPASTVYHSNFEGGLLQHSLNVYDCLKKMCDDYLPKRYSDDTIIIVSLLHDLSKKDYYEKIVRNQKLYKPNGSKRDEMGNFEWVAVSSYGIRQKEVRYVGADHGTNSVLLSRNYIELSDEEIIAIINHHAGMDNCFVNKDLDEIYNRFPLATMLHLADMQATYLLENKILQNESVH